jgi:hypothetical protein
MKSVIEKVTLSLNRALLEKLAAKAQKSMSEFVRDLIQREKGSIDLESELNVSDEILELKGCLKSNNKSSTKERVHEAARSKIRKT